MGTTVIKSLEPSITICSQDPTRMTEFFLLFFFKVTSEAGRGALTARSSLYFKHRSDQDLKGAPSLPSLTPIKEVQLCQRVL